MTATAGTAPSSPIARLAPGFQLGDYRVAAPLWPLRIAAAYRAEGPQGAATLYVVHARIAHHAGVRDHVIAGTRAAAALPEHRHRVRTLAAGLTGDILWIATEEVAGRTVPVHRTDAIAFMGGAQNTTEECYLFQKAMRLLGVVYVEHQARL